VTRVKNVTCFRYLTLLVPGSKQWKREATYHFHLVSSFNNACNVPYFTTMYCLDTGQKLRFEERVSFIEETVGQHTRWHDVYFGFLHFGVNTNSSYLITHLTQHFSKRSSLYLNHLCYHGKSHSIRCWYQTGSVLSTIVSQLFLDGDNIQLRRLCRDSSVGIATRYGMEDPGIQSRFSASLQTSPGAHPASYTMSTRSLSRD
jgi:hypothetical protein